MKKIRIFIISCIIAICCISCNKNDIDAEPVCWEVIYEMQNGQASQIYMFTNDYNMECQKKRWTDMGYHITKCEKARQYKTVEECRLQDTNMHY